jgi:ubiquinone/menaquinone biosynthesis C-methylase UbiE
MKLRNIYKKIPAEKHKLRITKKGKGKDRPAWIKIKNLPKEVGFVSVHLGKGKRGQRIQSYKKYLASGLFMPINYTPEEMKETYDEWSKEYDEYIKERGFSLPASKMFIGKIKKYIRGTEFLDLGAGTGLITERFVKEGFGPATLVDYSKEMLKKAKKRKSLKDAKFIQEDVRKLKLNKKFDLVTSFFSFAAPSYFDKKEIDLILKNAKKHVKKNGILAVFGHIDKKEFKKFFKELDSGIYVLDKQREFYTDYFIGRNV